jgi:hypothetical protein
MQSRTAFRRFSCPRLEMLEERRLLTAVAGEYLFYNGSSFDNNDPAIDAADDGAIAPDKSAFLSQIQYSPVQLTTNLTFDSEPRVYGDKLVWQGRGGTDGGTDDEIFYYDGVTITQLTQNTVPDRFPEISALGIAWERGSGTGQEVIFWNGSETILTDNSVFDGNASLSDNRLSWERGSSTALEIWSWDGVNPPANISNNSVVDVLPYANGDNTVWVTDSVPNRKVLLNDGVSNTIVGVSSFSIEDPRMDGPNSIAWESFKAGTSNDREIYYYDGAIVQRLSTNSFPDFDPQVSGNHVTWWGGVFNDFQIYLYDGATVREISTGIRNQFPQIDGQYVVWQGYDGTDDEIFLWDGYKVTQLTDNALSDTSPKIDGNHIVWQQSIPSSGNSQEIIHTYFTQETSSFDNVSSYTRGINGIMVDLADLPPGTELTADDFQFRVGNDNSPGSWSAAPAPSGVTIRGGAGDGGSDRVTITWESGAIKNTWLQVIVEGNDSAGGFNINTGLAKSHIFYFGSKIGDSGSSPGPDSFDTTTVDAAQVFASLGGGRPITDLHDYNRDGQVSTTDAAQVFANLGSIVRLYLGPEAPPEALTLVAAATLPASDSGLAFAFNAKNKLSVAKADCLQEPAIARTAIAPQAVDAIVRQLADDAKGLRSRVAIRSAQLADAASEATDELLSALI